MGSAADLTVNTIHDALGRAVNWWAAWSGVAWAPWWGDFGSIVACGGGHGDGSENDICRIDIATRTITRIKDAAPVFYKGVGSYCGDPTSGWLWANATEGDASLQVGEPFTSHFYAYLVAIPEDGMPGQGATNGWLFTPGRRSMPIAGQLDTDQAHKLRLGVDQKWTLHGSGATRNAGHGPACYDASRKRVWYIAADTNPVSALYWRDLASGAQNTVAISGALPFTFVGGYRTMFWSESHDLLLSVIDNDASLVVIDPVTNARYSPLLTGVGPSTGGTHWAWGWSDSWGALFYYDGRGGNTFWFLRPSGNPRTDPWIWTSQTVQGELRGAYSSAPSYNRLIHCEALGNVLIWAAKSSEPVQMIHVSAPV